MMTLRS